MRAHALACLHACEHTPSHLFMDSRTWLLTPLRDIGLQEDYAEHSEQAANLLAQYNAIVSVARARTPSCTHTATRARTHARTHARMHARTHARTFLEHWASWTLHDARNSTTYNTTRS
jgi:hypothetical protein